MKSMSSMDTPTIAVNPPSIVVLVTRPVGTRGFDTPTAGALPLLESDILHCIHVIIINTLKVCNSQ